MSPDCVFLLVYRVFSVLAEWFYYLQLEGVLWECFVRYIALKCWDIEDLTERSSIIMKYFLG